MKQRNALLPTAGIIAVLVVGFVIFTNVWTDRLWHVSFGFGEVFSTMLWTRLALFVIAGVFVAGMVVGNLILAFRLRPKTDQPSSSDLLNRYRNAIGGRFVALLVVVGVLVGLMGGGAGAAQVMSYQAWRNSVPFGQVDPQFGLDLSFFIFDYPWWRSVLSFVFTSLVFTLILTATMYFLLGAVRMAESGRTDRRKLVSPAAQAHLSVLAGVAMLVKGVDYWLEQYGLSVQDSELLTGITYVDATVNINALRVLAVISVLVAGMFFANVALRRWSVPVVGLVLMILSGIVLQLAVPGGVQAITVNPQEPDTEQPYIERHIAATRAAYGVDHVEIEPYDATTTVSAGQLREDAEALPGIRLIDPAVVGPTFTQMQQIRGYYQFPSVLDIDRYDIEGTVTDSVVGVRELNPAVLENQSWANVHTVYTHGFGLVAAYGNQKGPGGEPQWIVGGVPPTGQLAAHEPRIYFGELHNTYSIVGAPQGTPPVELDTPGTLNTYSGTGGVPIGSFFNRLLYAIKFADVNILLSDQVNSESKIIYDRTPQQRVEAAAPWLTTDANTYPAVVEGRIVWIVDGYTTSDSYPNSQRTSLRDATMDSQSERLPAGAQGNTGINYMRNSVKAVVDAYDGTVQLYAWDDEDPMLKTWQQVFPGTVLPKDEIPTALLEHFRYPEDLFKVQRSILGRYHVTNPHQWYQQSDLWAIPVDPNPDAADESESPYYLSVRWPGEENAVFSQTTTFVPYERQNLAAFMAVNADASSPEYGRLRILHMSDESRIDGPGQTFNAMTTHPTVAETLRPFLAQGSAQASYGNLLTLPVGGGLLYVQPVYVERSGSSGSYPVLQFVMVRFGEHVGIGTTLQEALDQVFAGDAGAETGENGEGTGTGEIDNPAAIRALQEAERAFTEADAALKAGDLSTYQAKIKEAQAALERAQRAMGLGG
ncbi:UPF0182 family membrane protein [Microlunatus sp. Y2014]|uniref:UPF0182 family membrane protein n=1 Tax=Microlunatus sp. Y2014 TaxID=3418488 RepID=UPI003DA70791